VLPFSYTIVKWMTFEMTTNDPIPGSHKPISIIIFIKITNKTLLKIHLHCEKD